MNTMDVNRDLYVYTNISAPYREHFAYLLRDAFRNSLFFFYDVSSTVRVWGGAPWSEWAISGCYPRLRYGIGRYKGSYSFLKVFLRQKVGSVHLVGSSVPFFDFCLIWLLGFLRLAIVIKWDDGGFVDKISFRERIMWNCVWRFGFKGAFTAGKIGGIYAKALGFRDNQVINSFFSHDVDELLNYCKSNYKSDRCAIRSELGIPANRNVILTVSRFVDWKRLEDVAAALALLEDADSQLSDNLEYILVGKGPWQAHLPILNRLKKIKVHIIDWVPPFEVRKYYCASDLFVLPSEGDIWGLVINEAMSCGLPVICTERIGAAEMIEDLKTGRVVPVRDPIALMRSIEDCLSDVSTMRRMGNAAKNRVQRWRSERGVAGLVGFLGDHA